MSEIAISAEYRRNPDKSRFWVTCPGTPRRGARSCLNTLFFGVWARDEFGSILLRRAGFEHHEQGFQREIGSFLRRELRADRTIKYVLAVTILK
jgi:hypothetical protein